MKILAIESSCDETAAAVLEQKDNQILLLSNIVATSLEIHIKWGGVVPEQAAREQLKSIIPVITEALDQSQTTMESIDAIAVTQGPGLIGSLLVGVETAKTLAWIYQKPLIPINHLIGHFYANWIYYPVISSQSSVVVNELTSDQFTGSETDKQTSDQLNSENGKPKTDFRVPTFPAIGLLVSGGHSDIILMKDHGDYKYLGGTRDDASGECFDKCARMLGYPYPGGPKISKIAEKGNPKVFDFPRPMIHSDDFDFSFSGLKTAFANLVQQQFSISTLSEEDAQIYWKHIAMDSGNLAQQEQTVADLCASLEQAIIDTLVHKTIKAAKIHQVDTIIIAGGVAANQKLVSTFQEKFDGQFFYPDRKLCMDNAPMIGAAAFFYNNPINPLDLQANPNLSLDN
jgi:N6-L-threonylcarbamoyladenine synthase